MIDEGMLKAAAAEFSRYQLECMAGMEDEPHVFSCKFERKMRRIIFKADHPFQHIARNVAAIFVAVVVALAAFLSICPDVRATVVEWICNISGGMVQYSCGEGTAEDIPEYTLGQVPEGYSLYEIYQRDGGATYVYYDNLGRLLSFTYTNGESISNLSFYMTEFKRSSVLVEDEPADLYMTSLKYERNHIVWKDPDNGVLFSLGHYGSQSDLLALAESVEIK